MKQTKIIMLTSVDEEEAIMDTYAAGAVNNVTKANYENVPWAIRADYNNMNYIRPDSADVLVKEADRKILSFIHKGYKQSIFKANCIQSTIKSM